MRSLLGLLLKICTFQAPSGLFPLTDKLSAWVILSHTRRSPEHGPSFITLITWLKIMFSANCAKHCHSQCLTLLPVVVLVRTFWPRKHWAGTRIVWRVCCRIRFLNSRMSRISWETELSAECVSDHPEVEKVRLICREHGIPNDLRGKIWQV